MAKTSKTQIIREIEAICNKAVEIGFWIPRQKPSHYKLQKMTQEALEDQLIHTRNFFAEDAYRNVTKLDMQADFGELAGLIDIDGLKNAYKEFAQRYDKTTKDMDDMINNAQTNIKQIITHYAELMMSEAGLTDEDIQVEMNCGLYTTSMGVGIKGCNSISINNAGYTDLTISRCFDAGSQDSKEAALLMHIALQLLANGAEVADTIQDCHNAFKELDNDYDAIFEEEREYAHKAFDTYLNAVCAMAAKK